MNKSNRIKKIKLLGGHLIITPCFYEKKMQLLNARQSETM